jgi:hypothetical protein
VFRDVSLAASGITALFVDDGPDTTARAAIELLVPMRVPLVDDVTLGKPRSFMLAWTSPTLQGGIPHKQLLEGAARR